MTTNALQADAAEAASTKKSIQARWHTAGLAVAFVLVLWAILCRHLGTEWTINEQYSYGWFVPFFALYLFWSRWENRPTAAPPPLERRIRLSLLAGVPALFFLLFIRLFEVANPDWRLLGWAHAFLVAGFTFFVLWCAGGKLWVRYFAFPIAFFFIAVPWLLIFETPLVQGLMRLVALGATEAATLCGIPAEVEGNLIRVNAGVVGVNEACSGVRSLQTSLMIGLLFGDLGRLSTARRIWLLLGALAIALVANFARAFFLVWVAADQGISAIGRWHDFAGYSILAAVCVGSILLATWLNRGRARKLSAPSEISEIKDSRPAARVSAGMFPAPLLFAAIAGLVLVEIAVESWYRLHERKLARQTPWTVQWPNALQARFTPIEERVARILRYDDGGQAAWPIALPSDASVRSVLFFFRWKPGSTSVTRARAHRPDICLPSSGWRLAADHGLRHYQAAENFALPFRHYSFVHDLPGRPVAFAHAFFCVHENRVRMVSDQAEPSDPTEMNVTRWMVVERSRSVMQGLRNPGQQVLELFFLSKNEIPTVEAESKFAELLPSLVRTGDEKFTLETSR